MNIVYSCLLLSEVTSTTVMSVSSLPLSVMVCSTMFAMCVDSSCVHSRALSCQHCASTELKFTNTFYVCKIFKIIKIYRIWPQACKHTHMHSAAWDSLMLAPIKMNQEHMHRKCACKLVSEYEQECKLQKRIRTGS